MKPWQTLGKSNVEKKKDLPGLNVKEHVAGIAFIMERSQPFWREIGKKKPIAAQFRVPGDEASSWFVAVDAQGGKAAVGVHPSPTVTWESDLVAMDAAFRGTILPGRVKVFGDFEEMRSLFKAISSTQLVGT